MGGRRRTLILQDEAFETAELVRASQVTSGTTEQAGRRVQQAEPGGSVALTIPPVGDIRPLMSGVPERDDVDLGLIVKLPGPVERMRYGWRRAQDGTASDVQIRQSPMVCGRRPDIIVRDVSLTSKSFKNNPRLIPIKLDHCPNIDTSVYGSDGLLLLHMNQTNDRVRSYEGLGYAGPSLYYIIGKVPAWGKAPLAVGELDCYADTPFNAGPMNHVVAADGVQFPDTGEIVVVVAAQDKMGLTSLGDEATDARFYLYSSPFAGEAGSWVLKSRVLLYGNQPDIATEGVPASIVNVVIERLPSGRLLLVWCTREDLYCSTSDDRGSTWSDAVRIKDNLNPLSRKQGPYGLDIAVMSNGLAVIVYTDNDSNAPHNLIRANMATTYDGKTFALVADIGVGSVESPATGATINFRNEPTAITVCERPDGFPQFYYTTHLAGDTPAPAIAYDCDWLCSATAIKRQLSMADDARTDVFAQAAFTAFHCPVSLRTPAIAINSFGGGGGLPAPPLHGFCGVSAVRWRGQIVLATQIMDEEAVESASEPIPDYFSNAVTVYRLNHWQPLKEKLQACTYPAGGFFPGHGVGFDPVAGRVYNLTWDAYDDPENWGYTLTPPGAGGTTTFVTAADGIDTDDGYMELESVAAAPRYYMDTNLPGTQLYIEGIFRYVFKIVSGTGPVGVAVSFTDGAVRGGVYISAVRTSADQIDFELFDLISSASLGTASFSDTGDGDLWYEVICAVFEVVPENQVSCFVRKHPKSTDPDWDTPYVAIVERDPGVTTVAGATEYIRFGHILGTGAVKSRWKTVQLHMTDRYLQQQNPPAPAAQKSPLFKVIEVFNDEDPDEYNVFLENWYGGGHAQIDDGVLNVMRASMATAVPAQYLSSGLSVTWRGEATSIGNYTYETAYQFGATKIVDAPVLREWRSETDGTDEIEIVFDAGASGRPFRPNAIALFRRNFPSFRVQLNDLDTPAGWAAASIDYYIGMPNQLAGPVDRYSHLWACLPADGNGWSYFVKPFRLTVYTTGPNATESPWRPHQFRTTDTGPRYYLWVRKPGSGAVPWVYRIADNTEDTLILDTDPSGTIGTPGESGRFYGDAIAIFSDRCAVEFEHLWPDTVPYLLGTAPNSHMLGYRYLRLLIDPVNHMDADEDFQRLGRMVAGASFRLDSPDFEWFWQESLDSGTDIEKQPGGPRRAMVRHDLTRRWQVDRNILHAKREADQVMVSPDDKGPKSWVEFVELALRMLSGGEAAALVWRSERARGAIGESVVQIASDYHDVAHVRVTGAGEAQNQLWECQTINGPEGAEDIDTPMAQVNSIVFEEDL